MKLLLHGIDTLQCAYFLKPQGGGGIDFSFLAKEKEALRLLPHGGTAPITLGGIPFLLHPYGTSSGYPFLLSSEDFKIQCGEFNKPSFFVTFKSQALWRESAFLLHDKFLRWATSAGLAPHRAESLSRIDFCFDYALAGIDFDEDNFLSRCSKDSQHRENGQIQTLTLGRGDIVLRVYDKVAEIHQQSDKVWFFKLWGQDRNVWRIEWQVRKNVLRQFGIRTFKDLGSRQADLLRYLVEDHTTLRSRAEDCNRSRWPLHPLWIDLRERVEKLPSLGITRIDGRTTALEERMVSCAASVEGYLKRMAAIYCVQNREKNVSFEKAIDHMRQRVRDRYDPLNWRIDVRKRIEEIECGEW